MIKIIKHDDVENRAACSSRAVLVIGVFIVYALAYLPLRAQVGIAAGLLAIAPVMLAGWLFGLRGGLLAGLLVTPLHTILMNQAGHPGWDVILRETNGLGLMATIAVGIAAGYYSDLVRALQKEIAERRQAEIKLRESEERLFLRRPTLEGLLRCCCWVLIAGLLLTPWFWPWYLAWPLALAALLPPGAETATALLFAALAPVAEGQLPVAWRIFRPLALFPPVAAFALVALARRRTAGPPGRFVDKGGA